jgi:hypothetical protein
VQSFDECNLAMAKMTRGKGHVGTPMTLHRRRRPKKALTGKNLADHHQAMLRKRFPKDKPAATRLE